MFSQDPFLSVGTNDYSFVKPNRRDLIKVDKTSDYKTVYEEVPAEMKNANMLIQLTSGAATVNLTYFPSNMNIFVLEDAGQVKITSKDGKPLSKVYVKCFSKNTGGSKSFHKDGYTDLRGTFDYASLNLEGSGNIQKFALLIVSEDYGAIMKETKPPKDMEEKEGVMLNLKSKKWAGEQRNRSTKCASKNQYMIC